MTDKKQGNKWREVCRALRDVGSFLFGAFLLYRTQNPSTVTGFVSLVLMGVLPVSILERWLKSGR